MAQGHRGINNAAAHGGTDYKELVNRDRNSDGEVVQLVAFER